MKARFLAVVLSTPSLCAAASAAEEVAYRVTVEGACTATRHPTVTFKRL